MTVNLNFEWRGPISDTSSIYIQYGDDANHYLIFSIPRTPSTSQTVQIERDHFKKLRATLYFFNTPSQSLPIKRPKKFVDANTYKFIATQAGITIVKQRVQALL